MILHKVLFYFIFLFAPIYFVFKCYLSFRQHHNSYTIFLILWSDVFFIRYSCMFSVHPFWLFQPYLKYFLVINYYLIHQYSSSGISQIKFIKDVYISLKIKLKSYKKMSRILRISLQKYKGTCCKIELFWSFMLSFFFFSSSS